MRSTNRLFWIRIAQQTMTAEIVIMNSSAVALAADSAVTTFGPAGTKIYNSANKLFQLTKSDPVAVMVYGTAQYLGMPWETIIKDFRESPEAVTRDHLPEYADALVKHVSAARHLFDPTTVREAAVGLVEGYYAGVVRQAIEDEVGERIRTRGAVTDRQVKLLARRVIESLSTALSGEPFLHNVKPDRIGSLSRELRRPLMDAMDRVFQLLPLSEASRAALRTMGAAFLLRRGPWPDGATCGIVVAGFGSHDYYPRSVHFMPRVLFKDCLHYSDPETSDVSNGHTAVVQAFAQHEMVSTFLEGIDPTFKSAVSEWVEELMKGLAQLQPAFAGVVPTVLADFGNHLDKLSAENFRNDVLGTVAILPKDELAAMAESLVNLTSFKRRVTMAPESVGGPIDVAVVSKGDGFVWIKRKHYFPPELNPHFFARYK